jgi:pimeloyl-ACP methyl ester carboxylesterase
MTTSHTRTAAVAAAAAATANAVVVVGTKTSSNSRKRRLVVLVGWLGSKPPSLRRYEALYRGGRLNMDTELYIAPPCQVVQTVLWTSRTVRVPEGWPTQEEPEMSETATISDVPEIQSLAWRILQRVHAGNYGEFYVHAFSNGGCFVWEQIRNILLATTTTTDAPPLLLRDDGAARSALASLRARLSGVVFDSCPIGRLERIHEALELCSADEQDDVARRYGRLDDSSLASGDPDRRLRVQQRSDQFVSDLKDDPLLVPQLYLYGRDDPLAPPALIADVVEYRTRRGHAVFQRVWDKSIHCGHLLAHPEDYGAAVESFVRRTSTVNPEPAQSSNL